MGSWEFLLQKEGDRFWEPLPARTVEIEEGRYRIVANCDRANKNVEIRLTHQESEEQGAINCFLKRNRRVSSEGLIVLVPFTYLAPGYWELSCSGGDIMSELLGEFWKECLEIQVWPQVEIEIVDLEEEYCSFTESEEFDERYLTSIPFDRNQHLPEELPTQLSPDWQGTLREENHSVVLPNPSPTIAENDILAALTGQRFSIDFQSDILLGSNRNSQSDPDGETANLDLPEPKRMRKVLKQCQTSSGLILPPKINRSSSNLKAVKSPQLPKLRQMAEEKIAYASKTSTSNALGIVKGSFSSVDEAFQSLKLQESSRSHPNSF